MKKKPEKQDLPDPRPVPPVRPDNDECCHSGCDPCVFDFYEDEMERYREALEKWQSRQPKTRS